MLKYWLVYYTCFLDILNIVLHVLQRDNSNWLSFTMSEKSLSKSMFFLLYFLSHWRLSQNGYGKNESINLYKLLLFKYATKNSTVLFCVSYENPTTSKRCSKFIFTITFNFSALPPLLSCWWCGRDGLDSESLLGCPAGSDRKEH